MIVYDGRMIYSERVPGGRAMADAALKEEQRTRSANLWSSFVSAEANGDWHKALDCYEQLLPQIENDYQAGVRAGWLYFKLGKYAESLKAYERAGRLCPDSFGPLHGAMHCHAAMGNRRKWAQALAQLNKRFRYKTGRSVSAEDRSFTGSLPG